MPKRRYWRTQIEWIARHHHATEPDFAIARDIAKRTQSWSRAQRAMAIRDAIQAHHDNRQLYFDIMEGAPLDDR